MNYALEMNRKVEEEGGENKGRRSTGFHVLSSFLSLMKHGGDSDSVVTESDPREGKS